jgi:hypothetical protein
MLVAGIRCVGEVDLILCCTRALHTFWASAEATGGDVGMCLKGFCDAPADQEVKWKIAGSWAARLQLTFQPCSKGLRNSRPHHLVLLLPYAASLMLCKL